MISMPAVSFSAASLASLPNAKRTAFLESLSDAEAATLLYDWEFWARPEQAQPPGDWLLWLILAGRGWGKTRTGAETTRRWVQECPLVNLIGATADDARDIMIEGESGILAICPQRERPRYVKSDRKLTWPNGATSLIFTADEPDRLRGKQHMRLWCFVAGTLVTTPNGAVPIEMLRAGDRVSTRRGARVILAAGARTAEVGTVAFSNGARLTGTAQHPVLTLHGPTSLAMLRAGDEVCAGERQPTATWRRTSEAGKSTSIDGSGSKPTAQSQRAIISTIGMGIAETTVSRTSSCSCQTPTMSCTTLHPQSTQPPAQYAASPLSGGSSVAGHCASTANTVRLKRNGSGLAAVLSAAGRSTPGEATSVASVVSTWVPAGKAIVYNLTVEDAPEYYANGILVHNCDEIASWRYPESWDQAMFGLRLGPKPRVIATTTPRPTPLIKRLKAAATTVTTRGSTYDNRANLAASFYTQIVARYEGTRLGRQELNAELLEDNPDALWSRALLDQHRVTKQPELVRIVVAIDPAATTTGDETGIVVAGKGVDGHLYVLDDRSLQGSPKAWASAAIAAYHGWRADRIVAETNNGGEMVEATLRMVDSNIPYTAVHASRGKVVRAEPISALYEQGKAHHLGVFAALEDQLCEWVPGDRDSPDRLDALVWAGTELVIDEMPVQGIYVYDQRVEISPF